MRKIFTAFLIITSSISSYAQDTLQPKQLEEVVITGQYQPQSARNSVYQVRVISRERIRLSGALNVQQVLMNQTGFRFSNDNTLGTTDVQLLGMSGRNVKILLDGVPMTDRGDTRESLGQVDVNTIDRIEIVEGPMSVSYGSDALAGVINIITKKNPAASFSLNARFQEETAGTEYHPFHYKGVHTQHIGAGWNKEKWQVSVGATHNEMAGFGGDAYGRGKTWRPKEQWMGHFKTGYSDNRFTAYYRLDALDESITDRGNINMQTYRATDRKYLTTRFMHQLQSSWTISNKTRLNSIAALTDYKRKTITSIHDFEKNTDKLTTGMGEQDVSSFNTFNFRSTLGYDLSSRVSLQPGIEISHDRASGARIKDEPVINDFAFFISAEIKPSTAVSIRPGLRFIKNSVYDAPPVIPSLNTKFRLNKSLDLRLAYAYGFRSPALRELYFNFIDGNHTIIGNPDLEAEYSNSFSGSLAWQAVKRENTSFNTTLGGFFNVFRNLINYTTSATSSDTTTMFNVDRFKTTGVTLENKFRHKELALAIGFSWIGRYNALSADEAFEQQDLPGFTWTPEASSDISWTAAKLKTTFGLFYKFTGKRPGYEQFYNPVSGQEEVRLTNISSFHWADLSITRPLLRYITLTGGIRNLFGVTTLDNTSAGGGVHTSGASLPVSYGRSYFLGMSFQFQKNNKVSSTNN